MYHELSLIGCFTRITVNVPRIVIKLVVLHELPLMYHELSLIVFGVLYHDADGSSSHVIPALACALARNLWLRPIIVIHRNMKTRHYISG